MVAADIVRTFDGAGFGLATALIFATVVIEITQGFEQRTGVGMRFREIRIIDHRQSRRITILRDSDWTGHRHRTQSSRK